MSAFRRFFTGVTDTGENVKEEHLRTRYYRGEQKKVCQEVVQFAREAKDVQFVHVNENRGEVMMEYRDPLGLKHDIVVTVYAITPVQSAVDLHVALRSRFVDLGFNPKLVARVYHYLDRKLTPLERN